VLYLSRCPTGTGDKHVLVATFDAPKEINHMYVVLLTACQHRERSATPGSRLRIHTMPLLAPETQLRAFDVGNALGSLSDFGYMVPGVVVHGGCNGGLQQDEGL
jgi:hypothetical protein